MGLFKKHKHQNSLFTKITFFDRRKPSLIKKMPAIPLTELYNGLVTVPEMKPENLVVRVKQATCPILSQAEPILSTGCLTSVEGLF